MEFLIWLNKWLNILGSFLSWLSKEIIEALGYGIFIGLIVIWLINYFYGTTYHIRPRKAKKETLEEIKDVLTNIMYLIAFGVASFIILNT